MGRSVLSVAHAVPDTAPDAKRGDMIDWREQAACAPYRWDPSNDPFFPAKGGHFDEARKICSGCPVKLECLEHARRVESIYGTHGFRAGHTVAERQAMRRQDNLDAAKKEAADEADEAEQAA